MSIFLSILFSAIPTNNPTSQPLTLNLKPKCLILTEILRFTQNEEYEHQTKKSPPFDGRAFTI